jgi:hypothetical protein
MQARLDAANLERVRVALLKLADAYALGVVPCEFTHLRSRAEIEPMVTRRTASNGYYEVHESDEWRDDSTTARALRQWLESAKTDDDREQEQRNAQATKIAQLERSVRFTEIPGFFPTPPAVIARMMERVCPEPGLWAMEPSAGKGDLLAALSATGMVSVGFEINWTLADICRAKGLNCETGDFCEVQPEPIVDRVVMNPPFEGCQDAKHIRRAYDWLKKGGRLVALASVGVTFSDRCQWFRDWMEEVGATVEQLPEGSFIDAFKSTAVNVVMIVVDRY